MSEWVGGWMRREEVREGLARTVTDQLKSLHLVNEEASFWVAKEVLWVSNELHLESCMAHGFTESPACLCTCTCV